jgi:hypothetical protein
VIKQAFRQFQYPTVPLHLGDDWLAAQYRKAAEAIDAQVFIDGLAR